MRSTEGGGKRTEDETAKAYKKGLKKVAASFLAESSKPLSETDPVSLYTFTKGERTLSRVFYHIWSYLVVLTVPFSILLSRCVKRMMVLLVVGSCALGVYFQRQWVGESSSWSNVQSWGVVYILTKL